MKHVGHRCRLVTSVCPRTSHSPEVRRAVTTWVSPLKKSRQDVGAQRASMVFLPSGPRGARAPLLGPRGEGPVLIPLTSLLFTSSSFQKGKDGLLRAWAPEGLGEGRGLVGQRSAPAPPVMIQLGLMPKGRT